MAHEPRLTLEGLRAVKHLQRALELGTGFALHVLVVESPAALHAVVEALKAQIGDEPELVPAPDTSESGWTTPYLDLIQRRAVEGHRPLLLDMTAFEARDQADWTLVLHRLNFGRNALVKALGRPVILAVSPRLEPVLAGEAPDLWSVRTLTIVAEVARRDRLRKLVLFEHFPERPPAHYHPDLLQVELDALDEVAHTTLIAASLRTKLAEALLAHSRPGEALAQAEAAVDLQLRQDAPAGDIASGLYSSCVQAVEAADQTLQPEAGLRCLERALARLDEGDPSDPRVASVRAQLHARTVRPLLGLDRASDALERAREGVATLRRVTPQVPNGSRSALIQLLLLEGEACAALNDLEGARFVFREAAGLAEASVASDPDLAGLLAQEALQREGFLLNSLGRPAEAWERLARADELGRAARGPSPRLREVTATSFELTASAFLDQRRPEEGVRKAAEAVQIWRGLAPECPLLGRQRLAAGLALLALGLGVAGALERACDVLRELCQLLPEIAKDGPSAFTPMVAHRLLAVCQTPATEPIRRDTMTLLRTLDDVLRPLGERAPRTHLEPAINASLALLRVHDPQLVRLESKSALMAISARLRAAPPEVQVMLRDTLLDVETSRAQLASFEGAPDEALEIFGAALCLVPDETHLPVETVARVGSLYDLAAKCLQAQNRRRASRAHWETAIRLLRKAHDQNPARYATGLSSALRFAAEAERALKHRAAARKLAAEALNVLWPAFEADPIPLHDKVSALLRLNLLLSRREPARALAERARLFVETLDPLPNLQEDQ